MYGNPRYKLLHTRKMLDSKALEKLENKNKQFMIEKIIQGVELENVYQSNPEQKPEMIKTIESNYKIARRVYQQLCFDISELFHEYIQSIDLYEQQDIEEDMKFNEWGTVENIKAIKDSMRLLNLFQDFYTATGRLPTFNELLVVPDGVAKPEEKINMKQLYDMFKNTNSHGIVSLPFLGLLFHYFHDEKSMILVKNATTELYKNLSYLTLSGGRQLDFQAVSDLLAQLSFSIKWYTTLNQKQAQIENEKLAKKINDERIFNPKINNPLDDVFEIINDPNVEHKKTTFPYVEPTVQLPDDIENTQKLIDDDYADLLNKIYGVNDVINKQKKVKKVEDLVDDVIKEPPPTDDYWWEEDIFDNNDNQETKDSTKMIVDDIKHNVDIKAFSDNILKNLRPRDNRTIQELIDDDFIPLDDRTQQELEDDDYISLESDNDDRVTIEDVFEPTPLYKIRPPKPDPITTDDIFNPPNNIGTTLPPSNFKKPEPNIVTVKDTVVPPLVNTIPPTAPPKTLDVDINVLSDNILRNLRPKDDRNLQNLIDDDFIPLDHRIQAELEDDDYKSLPGDAPPVINIDVTNAWDENKTTISKPRPIYKISTEYDRKLKVANKIKNKYLRTKIGTRKTQNKISAEWLKKAGFLDTKD